MQKPCGELQRIDEYHTSYLGYQYILLLLYGVDGYKPNVRHRDKCSLLQVDENMLLGEVETEDIQWEQATKRNQLTIRE